MYYVWVISSKLDHIYCKSLSIFIHPYSAIDMEIANQYNYQNNFTEIFFFHCMLLLYVYIFFSSEFQKPPIFHYQKIKIAYIHVVVNDNIQHFCSIQQTYVFTDIFNPLSVLVVILVYFIDYVRKCNYQNSMFRCNN